MKGWVGWDDLLDEPIAADVHEHDEECALFIVDGACTVCGVSHAVECTECGGRGFHRGRCARSDAT